MLQHLVFHCVFQTDIKFKVLEAKHQEEKLKLQQRHDGDVEKVRLKTVESSWFPECMWMEVLSWLWPVCVIIVMLMLKSEVGMITSSYHKVFGGDMAKESNHKSKILHRVTHLAMQLDSWEFRSEILSWEPLVWFCFGFFFSQLEFDGWFRKRQELCVDAAMRGFRLHVQCHPPPAPIETITLLSNRF